MEKLHITQDDHGYWMLSFEREDGALSLVAHQFPEPEHLIERANEMIRERGLRAAVVIDPPRPQLEGVEMSDPKGYTKPAPRKAGA